jgi:hypothetical protein
MSPSAALVVAAPIAAHDEAIAGSASVKVRQGDGSANPFRLANCFLTSRF